MQDTKDSLVNQLDMQNEVLEQKNQMLADLRRHLDNEWNERQKQNQEFEALRKEMASTGKKQESLSLLLDSRKMDDLNAGIEKLLDAVHSLCNQRLQTDENHSINYSHEDQPIESEPYSLEQIGEEEDYEENDEGEENEDVVEDDRQVTSNADEDMPSSARGMQLQAMQPHKPPKSSRKKSAKDLSSSIKQLVHVGTNIEAMMRSLKSLGDQSVEVLQQGIEERIKEWQDKCSRVEMKLLDVTEERNVLQAQISFLKEDSQEQQKKIGELQAVLGQHEKSLAELNNEIEILRPMKAEYEEKEFIVTELRTKLEQMTGKEQKAHERNTELENLLIQERLKVDQKMKELFRLDEITKEAKGQLSQVIETNNLQMKKLGALEVESRQIKDELRELRRKNKHLLDENHEIQAKFNDELALKGNEIAELKRQLENTNQYEDTKESQVDPVMQKDLEIIKLTNQLSELKELYEKIVRERDELNASLSNQQSLVFEQKRAIQLLSDKRDNAINEINRLKHEIEPTIVLKGVGSRNGSNVNSPKHFVHTPTMIKSGGFPARTVPGTPVKIKVSGNLLAPPPNAMHDKSFSSIHAPSTEWRRSLLNLIIGLKKDLENLYREFVICLPHLNVSQPQKAPGLSKEINFSEMANQELNLMERRINDAIMKAQDCLDQINETILE